MEAWIVLSFVGYSLALIGAYLIHKRHTKEPDNGIGHIFRKGKR